MALNYFTMENQLIRARDFPLFDVTRITWLISVTLLSASVRIEIVYKLEKLSSQPKMSMEITNGFSCSNEDQFQYWYLNNHTNHSQQIQANGWNFIYILAHSVNSRSTNLSKRRFPGENEDVLYVFFPRYMTVRVRKLLGEWDLTQNPSGIYSGLFISVTLVIVYSDDFNKFIPYCLQNIYSAEVMINLTRRKFLFSF